MPINSQFFKCIKKKKGLLNMEVDSVLPDPHRYAVCPYEDVSIKELILNTFGQVGNNN
jgi:hypothetical protein